MKIGVLTSVHPATDTRILFKQATSLVQAGHTVFLVARESPNPIGGGVRHVPLPIPKSRLGRIATCVRLYGRAVALRCDVYHLHDPELLTLAALLKRATGARIIFDVHEDVRRQIRNKYWIPRWMRPALAFAYGVLERLCLRAVDHVVIAEDSYAPIYAKYGAVPVRNYPALQLLAPLGKWSEPRAYSGRPKLVYCGTVAKIRGAMEMLAAVQRLTQTHPDVHLSIIGNCFPAGLETEIAAEIRALGIERNVQMHGRMPLDRAMEVVAQCDVGLAILHPDPNYLHSLPTKMFEYMALRLPVVVSDFALWKRIVDATGGGRTVDPLSVDDIAAAVESLVRDAQALRDMGERASIAVRETFSWEAEAKRLIALYDGKPAATPAPAAREIEPSLAAASSDADLVSTAGK